MSITCGLIYVYLYDNERDDEKREQREKRETDIRDDIVYKYRPRLTNRQSLASLAILSSHRSRGGRAIARGDGRQASIGS